MTALIHDQEAAALRLIELGADVNLASVIGTAPLLTACKDGSPQLVQTLIDKGADIDYQMKTNHGTAILFAAKAGRADIVELLLRNGADANLRDNRGRTPLSVALELGHAEVVSLLTGKTIEHREAIGWASDPTEDSEESIYEEKEAYTAEDAASFEAMLSSRTPEHRTFAIKMGIMQAGLGFTSTLARLAELTPEGSLTRGHALEARLLWARWLTGERLSDRADEAERRLLTVQSLIVKAGDRAADLMPTLARAILQLSKEHPSRDVDFALETLTSHARRCVEHERVGEFVLTVLEIVEHSAPVAGSISSDGIAALVELAERKISAVEPNELVDTAQFGIEAFPDELPAEDQRAETHRQLRQRLRASASQFFESFGEVVGSTANA
jgi:hypothetical protein